MMHFLVGHFLLFIITFLFLLLTSCSKAIVLGSLIQYFAALPSEILSYSQSCSFFVWYFHYYIILFCCPINPLSSSINFSFVFESQPSVISFICFIFLTFLLSVLINLWFVDKTYLSIMFEFWLNKFLIFKCWMRRWLPFCFMSGSHMPFSWGFSDLGYSTQLRN